MTYQTLEAAVQTLVTTNSALVSAVAETQVRTAASEAAAAASANNAAASAVTAQATIADTLDLYGDAAALSQATTEAAASASQASALKAQTETARDEAVAGLGAADQSLNLVHLAYGVAGAVDLAGQAVKEAERNVNFRIQSGEVTVTQADSPAHTRTYASAAVTLPRAYRTTDYQIEVECIAAAPFLGCEGQVQVQSRSTNGFVLAIAGSATSATLRWKAINPNAK